MAKLDEEIDRLFQLPLADFTAARNALAKDAGAEGKTIKTLTKPPVAAWAVNQLYWKDRDRYDTLVDTAVQMRKAHKSVMEGKNADLRVAGKMHEEALEAALKATVALMKANGQPVTEATRHTILNTLRALPSQEAPGRLTETLAPGGFEMLSGITIKPASGRSPGPHPAGAKPATKAKPDARADREAARAREHKLALERAVREADQQARHAEFEAARAARDASKAEKKRDEAQKAFDDAREALKEAEREVAAAAKAREVADRRVQTASSALDAARAKLESS